MLTTASASNSSPTPSPGIGSLKWRMAALFLILLLVVICVWPAMHSLPFQDDIPQLEKSSHFTTWTEVFKPDAFNFYRPVKNAVFMLAAPLEKNLPAWHWIGLAAYLAATVGIYRITSICLKSRGTALLATAVWALSPTCASTAIWLSCANISIGLVFAAGVFHFHERLADRPSAGSLAACLIFYSLALLCYESMIVIPGLLFIRDLQQRRISINRTMIIRYVSYAVVALAFLIIRHQFAAKSIAVNDLHSAFAPGTKPIHLSLSAPWFLWRHFMMWIFPFGTLELLGSYGWMRSASAASLAFGWVFLASLLAAAVYTWRRFPAVSYGLLFFIVASIPAGNFLPGFNGPINDAYVTIPSVGLAMVFAMICERLIRELVKRKREAQSGILILVAILAVLLAYRLPACGAYFRYWAGVWQDPIKLVVLMSESRPYQYQSKAYASSLLYRAGYIDQAQALAEETLREAPWSHHAKLTLARVAGFRGDLPESERLYQIVGNSPGLAANLKTTSLVELAEMLSPVPGRKEDAAQFCREALKSEFAGYPLHLRAVILLAQIYKDQGNAAKARTTLERGLTFHRGNEALQKQLASLNPPATPQQPPAR